MPINPRALEQITLHVLRTQPRMCELCRTCSRPYVAHFEDFCNAAETFNWNPSNTFITPEEARDFESNVAIVPLPGGGS